MFKNTFQAIAIVGMAGAVLAVALHFLAFGHKRPPGKQTRQMQRMSLWERCVCAVTALAFLVLAVTGFVPALMAKRLSGWLLLAHCTAAPVFAMGLVAAAITWAEQCRFQRRDVTRTRQTNEQTPHEREPSATRLGAGRKAVFWLTVVVGCTAIVAMMLSMVNIFGTPGQELLFEVHRYAALVLVILAIVHAYSAALARRRG